MPLREVLPRAETRGYGLLGEELEVCAFEKHAQAELLLILRDILWERFGTLRLSLDLVQVTLRLVLGLPFNAFA